MTTALRYWKVVVLWTLSLLTVGTLSSWAQTQGGRPSFLLTTAPTVVFGNDVGFRIERTEDGIQIGKVVVRIDGRWVDTAVPSTR